MCMFVYVYLSEYEKREILISQYLNLRETVIARTFIENEIHA